MGLFSSKSKKKRRLNVNSEIRKTNDHIPEIEKYKLLLIGDLTVGKTSFLLRFCEGTFNEQEIIISDYKSKQIDIEQKIVNVEIWDTGGQERFRTITSTFYRGAHGILLMYDVSNEKSFANVKGWMHDIDLYAKNGVRVILIGNKCDLVAERTVSYDDGKDLADEYGLEFFEASAKTAINVNESFFHLAELVSM
eukprot:TRINITY_DN10779_c0_g1_i1.p1 TRINITY_DN10779_c0_g1~~TRINITY_DN10779_c0_g1_i1.p1  ORF type:complete len:194 (-),score=28.68 TRINITY_DN10779_c0_g1_i1:30-611(-)